MKEIKARAWDSKLQKFIYQEMVNGQVGVQITSDDNTPLELFKNLGEWQQYTGWIDKNGIEIWQGDILLYADETKSAPVEWYQDGWAINGVNLHFLASESEVVSNIYEDEEAAKKEITQ